MYHIPALLYECMDGLNICPDGTYVDVTFGGGGHSCEILNRLGQNGRLLGFDQDAEAKQNIPEDERFTFVHSNFRFLSNFLRFHGIDEVDGILADLGVSSRHFDDAGRGFSFRFEGNLDMRMNRQSKKDAAQVLNTYTKEQLADVFYRYGELNNSRKISESIVNQREKKQLGSIGEFVSVIQPFLSKKQEKKELAQVFQALRMEVNNETEVLKKMLLQAGQVLKPGGRLVVVSYHSLEDRLVKNFMKTGNFKGVLEKDFFGNPLSPFKLVTKKHIVPSEEEIARNPRVRSAKLRIAEKMNLSEQTTK
ncbi:MAG: 16S rRNA (cytosine(1402)-N(4))-methyltransferase RsmH [Candidatus Azobacteroides sp.]|nr:16S rRNA (cytosine(1402)-N(4))-methyltransferase RsmH [Candidatus Azobacteroides sp.]